MPNGGLWVVASPVGGAHELPTPRHPGILGWKSCPVCLDRFKRLYLVARATFALTLFP